MLYSNQKEVTQMLRLAKSCSELDFSKLMEIYEEGNRENAAQFWPQLSEYEQTLRAQQEFYAYLHDDFFKTQGAYYAIWEEDGRYCSALRLEPYGDGLLLEALETKPDCRCRGYAAKLMQAVLLCETRRIYSHVGKKNTASLRVHKKCGFVEIFDYARYIDGTVSSHAVTLCHDAER